MNKKGAGNAIDWVAINKEGGKKVRKKLITPSCKKNGVTSTGERTMEPLL